MTILSRHPDLIPTPLDAAVGKAWDYASERARHIREGNDPTKDEAKLIVGIAATGATYLSKKCGVAAARELTRRISVDNCLKAEVVRYSLRRRKAIGNPAIPSSSTP